MLRTGRRCISVLLIFTMVTIYIPAFDMEYAFASKAGKPGKIKSVKVKVKGKTAKISWSKSKNAKKYQVMVKTGKKTVKIKKTKKKALTLKKLKAGKKYTVMVRGIAGKKKGAWKKKSFKVKAASTVQPAKNDPTPEPDPTPTPTPTPNPTPTPDPKPDNGDQDGNKDDTQDGDQEDTDDSTPTIYDDDDDNVEGDDDSRFSIADVERKVASGELDAEYNDFGGMGYVDGHITDVKVTDEESAHEALYDCSRLVGKEFDAYNTQISSEEATILTDDGEKNYTIYRVAPIVNGVSVYGSEIVMNVDENGNVTTLYNTYDQSVARIEIDPAIDPDEAEIIAAKDFVDEYGISDKYDFSGEQSESEVLDKMREDMDISNELMIYAIDSEIKPFLVYKVTLSHEAEETEDEVDGEDSETIHVDTYDDTSEELTESDDTEFEFSIDYYIVAVSDGIEGYNAGDIYQKDNSFRDAYKNAKITVETGLDQMKTLDVQKDGSKVRLIDSVRNIKTHKAVHRGTEFLDNMALPGTIVEGTTLPTIPVTIHSNLETVYDYYKSLGRKSYDGKGGLIKATYDFRSGSDHYGASMNDSGQIVFGNKYRCDYALDVTAHEFTHGVIGTTCRLGNNAAPAALNEAYADVMGMLIEGKTGRDKWVIGEDSAYPQDPEYGKPIIREMSDRHTYSQYNDLADCHNNARIMDYIAYKMMMDQRTSGISNKKWATVYLDSIMNMSPSATFFNARDTLVVGAKKAGFTADQVQAIKDAFTDAGVVSKRIRILMQWNTSPKDLDLHVVGPDAAGSGRFHLFYENMTVLDSNGKLVAELNYDDTDGQGPEIITLYGYHPGTYYIFVHDYTHKDYTNSANLRRMSNAVVGVYRGDFTTQLAGFAVTQCGGSDAATYWNVCKLTIGTDGSIKVDKINTLSNTQNYE